MENDYSLLRRYEAFKLQWMIDHGYTLGQLVQELELGLQENDLRAPLPVVFDDWEYSCGFSGAIWPCFDEWLECEAIECKHHTIRIEEMDDAEMAIYDN